MDNSDSDSVTSFQYENGKRHRENSSTSDDMSTSSSTLHPKEARMLLAENETRAVRQSRACVIGVLLLSATIAGVVTFMLTRREAKRDFEALFLNFATEMEEVSRTNAEASYAALNALSLALTTIAQATTDVWPAVTIPNFHIHGSQALRTAEAEFLALSPVVSESTKSLWEAHAQSHQEWILQDRLTTMNEIPSIPEHIHELDNGTTLAIRGNQFVYLPLWQMSPVPLETSNINLDLLSHPTFHRIFDYMLDTGEPVLSEVVDMSPLFDLSNSRLDENHPRSFMVLPVAETFDEDSNDDPQIIAFLTAVIPWEVYFSNVFYTDGLVYIVVRNNCGDTLTYEVNGPKATFTGIGDLHDHEFDHLEYAIDFEPFYWHSDEQDSSDVNCHYSVYMYPSDNLEIAHKAAKPVVLTLAVISIFFITGIVFLSYDAMVERRQRVVMTSAEQSHAIVSSLFPEEVRARLFKNPDRKRNKKMVPLSEAPKTQLSTFLNNGEKPMAKESSGPLQIGDSKPIADLFPHTTVMFADIAGFTAWSSSREPSQVFTLLETLYQAFDNIAKRRRVFKVETIGDCYVAVAGLPNPRKDHAVVMARFARDCLVKVDELTKALETTLGPGTADLTMRMGLHSGPVTAGVLRGAKSRFQLFGDTVNTAARMESTGERNRIQISEQTSNLLVQAGKAHWTTPRKNSVVAKGKGELKTYWLNIQEKAHSAYSTASESAVEKSEGDTESSSAGNLETVEDISCLNSADNTEDDRRVARLASWITEVLLRHLKLIAAARKLHHGETDQKLTAELEHSLGKGTTVQEQVTEFVPLAGFDVDVANKMLAPDEFVKLSPKVAHQLHSFVLAIVKMYHNTNGFHNVDHASHVTMSVSKLLSRIVAPDVDDQHRAKGQAYVLSLIHERTYGISSDPLAQFAVVLSALIHDVDHRGVPNFLLAKENEELATKYNNRSVAEQNSVDRAWEVLMRPGLEDLRACIYATPAELKRFRQLVVNSVMATDIFDKDFATLRKKRWEMCFNKEKTTKDTTDDRNRKATIVMEHLIQASDVAHTMQHWHVFQKWNQNFFKEQYAAFRAGRSDKDPSEGWYQGELGFFDNYIIPLARKLAECGVFGVSSDEYLNYALENRREWSDKGVAIVEKMKANATGKWGP